MAPFAPSATISLLHMVYSVGSVVQQYMWSAHTFGIGIGNCSHVFCLTVRVLVFGLSLVSDKMVRSVSNPGEVDKARL